MRRPARGSARAAGFLFSLAAQHALPFLVQQRPETLRMERPPRAIDEAADAEFVGRAVRVINVTMLVVIVAMFERGEPARRVRRGFEIEAPGRDHLGDRHLAEAAHHLPRARIEAREDPLQARELVGVDEVGLVDHQHVAELDLLDQQFHQRAVVLVAADEAAIGEALVGAVVAQEIERVDHGDHRVEPRDVLERDAVVVDEREGLGDRHRFGDAGRFDQDRVERTLGALVREPADFDEQIVAQRAAEAAV